MANTTANITSKMTGMSFRLPSITQFEMDSFHQRHFSRTAADIFGRIFLHPSDTFQQNTAEDLDEDDGLGYYDDGVKRTLTDEQIAIFRHSELEALQRAQTQSSVSTNTQQPKSKTSSSTPSSPPTNHDSGLLQAAESHDPGQLSEEGELPATDGPTKNPKKKKKNRRKPQQRAWLRPEGGEVIDLRKRTWDVVDKGLASLDYEDDAPDHSVPAQKVQRQQISYED